MVGKKRYDRIYLLTNYDFDRSKNYCTWLEAIANYEPSAIDLYSVDLISPIDYGDIYTQVSANLKQVGLPRDDVELIFRNFKKAFIERALSAEMSHHLGYGPGQAKPEGGTNHRNGSSAKTVPVCLVFIVGSVM